MELREQFILADGVSQSMSGFIKRSPGGSVLSDHSSSPSGMSWSTRSPSSASGPITKIREKTQYPTPWKQRIKTSPDGEVRQIMGRTEPDGTKIIRSRVTSDLRSPRDILQSPGATPSRSSSRASTNSRPSSRADSETSETSEPEIFTTVQKETRKIGGRSETTMTYQTHVVQTRTAMSPTARISTPTRIGTPTRVGTPTSRGSKIPTPYKKK